MKAIKEQRAIGTLATDQTLALLSCGQAVHGVQEAGTTGGKFACLPKEFDY